MTHYSTDDFAKIHWHDNAIHAFRIEEGADGCGKLVFDIDFITEWLKSPQNLLSFRIIPSDLTFHEVSDLVLSINYAAISAALQPASIQEIHRELVAYPNGQTSFAWKIELNSPSNSFITFCAAGFTQTPRLPAVVSSSQCLPPEVRKI